MSRSIVLVPLIIGVAVLIGLMMFWTRAEVVTKPPEPTRKPVRAMAVQRQPLQMTVRSQGNVVPRTETQLVSEVGGKVLYVSENFVSGGFFEKGDILLRIEPSDYRFAIARSEAEVARAELLFQQQVQEAEIAREEWASLHQDEIPDLVGRVPQLNEAEAALASARANLEKARLDLDRTIIRAPYPGRVRSKMVGIGQYVTPGTPVAAVYAVDYAEIRLPVPDEALAHLPDGFRGQLRAQAQGPAVTLKARFAGQEQKWAGYLSRIEGEIDPLSRMIYVVARVEDPYKIHKASNTTPLTIGLFVEAEIEGRIIPDLVVVPRASVRNNREVMVIDEAETLHFREVTVHRYDGEIAYVSSGLKDGERVCVSALATAVDGMLVSVIEEVSGSAAALAGGKEAE